MVSLKIIADIFGDLLILLRTLNSNIYVSFRGRIRVKVLMVNYMVMKMQKDVLHGPEIFNISFISGNFDFTN